MGRQLPRDEFVARLVRAGELEVSGEGRYIASQTWIEGTFVREFTQSPAGPLPPNGQRVVWDLMNIFQRRLARRSALAATMPPSISSRVPSRENLYPNQEPQHRTAGRTEPAIRDGWPTGMDGMHRIAHVLLDGRDQVRASRFLSVPEPDYRDCQPADLPY